MNLSYPFVPPRRHPNCLQLVVRLRGAPCRRERRAFFTRMHAEARRLGIVMSHKLGRCLLFGAERLCTTAHRHQMVNWLIDQAEVERVQVGELGHLGDVFVGQGRQRPVDALEQRVANGVVAQWVAYLHGRM